MTAEAVSLDHRTATEPRVRGLSWALTSRLAVPLLCTAAALGFYWEIVFPDRILADYDVWAYFYPLREYAAEAIRSGRFPLWNPDTFLGSPFFANPQTSLLYPGTVLFYALPTAYAYSLSVIAHVLLAALLTYACLRSTFEVGRAAALVGAFAFAFGGFLSAQVGHINQLSASAWLPGVVLAADLGVRRRSVRWSAIAGVGLAVQLLAGHAQESYMTLWVVGIVLIWRALVAWPGAHDDVALTLRARLLLVPGRAARAAGSGAILTLLGFGLAGIQLLPTLELSEESIRSGGMTYLEAASFSLQPPLLVRSLLPGYTNNVFSEYIGYVGAVSLAFAAVGVVLGPWKPMVCALALTQVGMFFALGGANPFYRYIFDVIPGLDLFRVPARWLFVYSFGAAALAAVGVDWTLSQARRQPSPWRVAIFALLVVGVGVAALPLVAAAPRPIATFWIAGLAGGFLLAFLAVRLPTRATGVAVVLVVLVELRLAAMDLPQRHPVPSAAIEEQRPVVAHLQSTAREGRILSVAPTEYEIGDHVALEQRFPGLSTSASFAFKSALKLDEVMSPNIPLRYGLSTVDGYDGGVLPLRRFLQIGSLLVPATEMRADGVLRTRLIAIPDEPLLRLFNVRTVIGNEVSDVEIGEFRFDRSTARTLQPGQTIRVDLPQPVDISAIAVLNSATTDQGSQTDLGAMTLFRTDDTVDELPLTYGEDVFHEMGPSSLNAFQPTAGLSRGGRTDTAIVTRFEEEGEAVTSIEWTWTGRGPWNLRAATILPRDGSQQPLLLQPGFVRRSFSPVEIYERPTERGDDLRLIPTAMHQDDTSALDILRSDRSGDAVVLPLGTQAAGPGSGDSTFRRRSTTPEQLLFERVEGRGAGYLVVDDAWFPGWQARIDGAETPVVRANVYFKAVWVPEGAQRVELTYEPTSLRLGAMTSAGATIVLLVLLILGGRWRRA